MLGSVLGSGNVVAAEPPLTSVRARLPCAGLCHPATGESRRSERSIDPSCKCHRQPRAGTSGTDVRNLGTRHASLWQGPMNWGQRLSQVVLACTAVAAAACNGREDLPYIASSDASSEVAQSNLPQEAGPGAVVVSPPAETRAPWCPATAPSNAA